MCAKSGNALLTKAKSAKKDEFYTQLCDIEREVVHYREHFRGKTVLCNCDDPRVSNFFHYFSYNFEFLGLKKLISICYKNQNRDLFSTKSTERAIWLEYNGDKNGNRVPDPEEIGIHYLEGDGDFRKEDSIKLLTQSDIVVTNPPFSLFREFYDPELYPKYANYDAIDVGKTADIPCDYDGVMGVPLTFMDKFNPLQFELIGIAEGDSGKALGLRPYDRALKKLNPSLRDGQLYCIKDGKPIKPFDRILIRRRHK